MNESEPATKRDLQDLKRDLENFILERELKTSPLGRRDPNRLFFDYPGGRLFPHPFQMID